MLGRDIANVSNLDLVLHHASEDLSQTATSGGSESRKRRAMIRTNSKRAPRHVTCQISSLPHSSLRLCPEAIGKKINIVVSYLFCIPWYPTLTRGENRRFFVFFDIIIPLGYGNGKIRRNSSADWIRKKRGRRRKSRLRT